MTAAAAQWYDSDGPLPAAGEVLLLEASAGTGKTHAIKELVRRFIAEGVARLDEMLIMTFSRSAAQELRDRIRQELDRYLLAGHGSADAIARVRVAQSSFDAASIGTIHQSCIDAFARLGIAADADPDEVIAEQARDLVEQVFRDVYLSRYAEAPELEGHRPNPTQARAIANAVLADPDAGLAGLGASSDPKSVERLEIAAAIRSTFPARQRDQGISTFDDVVLRLADTIRGDEDARRNLESRFKVVLVDEFQDTDPSQWAIVATAFAGRPDCRVVLIGDPKQGIYSFRGADIHSYAAARSRAQVRTLGVNYRSDPQVVAGLMQLLLGRNLGGKEPGNEIMVGRVTANQSADRLADGTDGEPRRVRIRCLRPGPTTKDAAERLIAEDLADALVADLISRRPIRSDDGTWRTVVPSDFAVIVRENKQAELIRATLVGRGVPAVVNSRTTVFVSQAAADWATLLPALEQPRPGNARAAALTPFFGVSPADLATGRERVTTDVADQLRSAAQEFATGGVPAVMAWFSAGQPGRAGIAERMLRTPDGERYLTDVRHVAALLHTQQRTARLGLAGLSAWLQQERSTSTRADSDERSESLVRRIDTDADAVQVVTIHASKGLQYPITYVPFAWGRGGGAGSNPVATVGGTRVIDVRGASDETGKQIKALATADAKAESLRMLYVALTRGISEVVMWWTPVSKITSTSPLQRFISGHAHGHALPNSSYPAMDDPAVVFAGSQVIAVHDIGEARGLTWTGRATHGPPVLTTAPYTRSRRLAGGPAPQHPIDTAWSRPSFTALTRDTGHRPGDVDTDHAQTGVKDDEADVPLGPGTHAALQAPPSPLAGVPSGAAFGDLAHRVLERVNLDAPDLDVEVLRSCTEQLRRTPMAAVTAEALAAGLSPALRTPLGGRYAATTLASISSADRLAELGFELALGTAGPPTSVGRLGRIIAAAAPAAWLADYGCTLACSEFSWKELRGFLTGSIDALLRVGGRHIVVDYKSNLVGPRDGDVGRYTQQPLRQAMVASHYPLQALLYCVAVHRFLQWRMPGYDPAAHLGEVRYLFLRGMAGPDSPVLEGWPTGVFGFDPGPDLVVALDEALGGGR